MWWWRFDYPTTLTAIPASTTPFSVNNTARAQAMPRPWPLPKNRPSSATPISAGMVPATKLTIAKAPPKALPV
ncbi:MAG: hypothetical protein RLZZ235_2087, partial [Pseudomonadota bacterium]